MAPPPPPPPQRTGALAALEAAVDAGVRVVFANPGTSEMWLVAALDRVCAAPRAEAEEEEGGAAAAAAGDNGNARAGPAPPPRAVLCLHETVAAGAADGFARVAHFSSAPPVRRGPGADPSPDDNPRPHPRPRPRPRPLAAALLHLGPGLANALSALHNARRARCHPPVLAIVGDMARWHQGAGAPLEMRGRPAAGGSAGAAGGAAAAAAAAAAAPEERAPPLPAIEALAGTVSRVVVRAGEDGLGAGAAVRRAVRAAVGGQEVEKDEDGAVATVILPHDVSWLPADLEEDEGGGGEDDSDDDDGKKDGDADADTAAAAAAAAAASAAADALAARCAAALRRFPRGASALLLGGRALLDEPLPHAEDDPSAPPPRHRSLLALCGAVAAATGARLLCEPLPARVDRGAGRPQVLERLPYFPDAAARELARFRCVVLVDCPRPVASFGYDGARGRLLPEEEDGADEGGGGGGGGLELGAAGEGKGPLVFELDGPTDAAVAAAARALCARVGGDAVVPGVNCGGVFAPPQSPPPPPLPPVAASSPLPLTPAAMCAVVAALQPRGCVLVDESLTSGGAHWGASRAAPPFTQLLLTGGAIGSGPPLSLGAAAALRFLQEEEEAAGRRGRPAANPSTSPRRPLRVLINFQADGSLLYSPQALWSQARERLPVVTLVCANRAYAILRLEQAKQRIPAAAAGPPPPPSSSSAAAAAPPAGMDDDDGEAGPNHHCPPSEALTAIDRPTIDFVSLARGLGVPAATCSDAAELARLLRGAIARAEAGKGPFLIQANLP